MYRLFARASGLDRLIARYPAGKEPTGTTMTWQTVMIGPVVYRRCVTAHVAAEGLYLHVHPPLRSYPLLFIPWSEVSAARPATLHWQKGLRLSIGRPTVATVTSVGNLLRAIRPHLPAGLVPPG